MSNTISLEEFVKKAKKEISDQTDTKVELKFITLLLEDGNGREHEITLGEKRK